LRGFARSGHRQALQQAGQRACGRQRLRLRRLHGPHQLVKERVRLRRRWRRGCSRSCHARSLLQQGLYHLLLQRLQDRQLGRRLGWRLSCGLHMWQQLQQQRQQRVLCAGGLLQCGALLLRPLLSQQGKQLLLLLRLLLCLLLCLLCLQRGSTLQQRWEREGSIRCGSLPSGTLPAVCMRPPPCP